MKMEIKIVSNHHEQQHISYKIADTVSADYLEMSLCGTLKLVIMEQGTKKTPHNKWASLATRWIRRRKNVINHEHNLIEYEQFEKVIVRCSQPRPGLLLAHIQLPCNNDVNRRWFKDSKKIFEIILPLFGRYA